MATAQEKFDLGYLMGEADYKQLLRDPKSTLSKFYQECAAEADLKEYLFIRFMENARIADQQARKETEQEEKIYARAEARQQQAERFNAELNVRPDIQSPQPSVDDLKSALRVLLEEPLTSMNAAQLVGHYQKLMNNFNQQALAKFGSEVELSNGLRLKVPAEVKPLASISKIIAINPALAQEVIANPGLEEALAMFHAKNAAGPLGAVNMTRLMLKHNGKKPEDVSMAVRKELMQRMSDNLLSIQQEQPEIFKQAYLDLVLTLKELLEVKPELSLDNTTTTSSLTKPPAKFAQSPQPGQKKVLNAEEDVKNKNNVKWKK